MVSLVRHTRRPVKKPKSVHRIRGGGAEEKHHERKHARECTAQHFQIIQAPKSNSQVPGMVQWMCGKDQSWAGYPRTVRTARWDAGCDIAHRLSYVRVRNNKHAFVFSGHHHHQTPTPSLEPTPPHTPRSISNTNTTIAPPRKGCVINGQTTMYSEANNIRVRPSPPPPNTSTPPRTHDGEVIARGERRPTPYLQVRPALLIIPVNEFLEPVERVAVPRDAQL